MAKRINLNEVDQKVAAIEGKKINLPMGQIKETRACVIDVLCGYSDDEVLATLAWHRKQNAKKGEKR